MLDLNKFNYLIQLHKSYRSGAFDPVTATSKCLQHADQMKHLNAFTNLSTEIADVQSNESSGRFREGKQLGVLDGVQIAVKDNFCVRHLNTTCASRYLSFNIVEKGN